MFTITANGHLGMPKILFAGDAAQSAPEYNKDKDATLSDIRARLQDIRDIKDPIVQARMMNSIRSSLESVDKKNRAQTSALESELDNVINGNEYSKEEKDKIRTLKKSLDDGVTKAREDYSQARKSIPVSTAPALPPGAPAISSRGAIAPEAARKANFTQETFDKALSQAIVATRTTESEIYRRIVGEVPGSPLDRQKLFEKTAQSVTFLQELGAGNAGLYALLYGKSESLMQAISQKVKKENKPIEIPSSSVSLMSPTVQNIVGALVTTGVAVVTQGVGVVGHTAQTERAESYIDEIKKDADSSILSRIGKGLSWIGDAFMGRKLSFTLGEERVAEYKKNILKFAEEIMKMDMGTFTEKYGELLKTAMGAGIDINTPDGKEKIQKAIIQSYIVGEGYKREGSNWQMNIGLFFVGAGRDQIALQRQATRESAANELEREITRRAVSSQELIDNNVSIEQREGKWIHTIPAKIRFSGDNAPIDVVIDKTSSNNGVYSVTREKVGDIRFSYADGKYVVSFSDRVSQPTFTENITPQADVTRKQDVSEVKKLRTTELYKEKSNKSIPQILYDVVGHQSAFSVLAKCISSGDTIAAKRELDNLAQKYKSNRDVSSYIRQLQGDFSNVGEWDTYMSGNKDTRSQKNPKYSEVRTASIIAAEGRLASKLGFPKPSDESNFFVGGEYEGKQISEILPSQELTSMQFMTPLDEKKSNSLHRVSINDGSFQVSHKTLFITDNDKKYQIVNGLMKSSHESRGILVQLKKLNSFLAKNGVTKELKSGDYANFLSSGNISDLGVPGLIVQAGKDTKFLEARAKVAGNICLNTTYAIAYPAFEFKRIGSQEVVKQDIAPVATMDASAALDITTVETRQSTLGISTLGILGRLIRKPDGTITTRPGEVTTITTKPGEATILINGKPVGLVNTTNNTITLTGGGTFRLAPGQTMEQFLGSRGLVSPITEVIPATDGTRTIFRLANGTSLLFVLADEIVSTTK